MEIKTENVIFVVLAVCLFFGITVGFMGLGLGLIFLPITKSIGVGILSSGIGTIFGLQIGGKRLIKSVALAWKEAMQQETV